MGSTSTGSEHQNAMGFGHQDETTRELEPRSQKNPVTHAVNTYRCLAVHIIAPGHELENCVGELSSAVSAALP